MYNVPPRPSSVIRYRYLGRGAGPTLGVPLSCQPLASSFRPRRSASQQSKVGIRNFFSRKWSFGNILESFAKSLGFRHSEDLKNGKKARSKQELPFGANSGVKMRSYIQFITTPSVDTPGTGLLLHFDDKRYFFGQMHEGLQRANLQQGSKLLRLREIFLTGRTESQTTGGLLGMILTIADATKSSLEAYNEAQRIKKETERRRTEETETVRQSKAKADAPKTLKMEKDDISSSADAEPEPLRIHGAPNIMHTVAAARAFIFRQGLPMDVDEFIEGTERTGPGLDWRPSWEDHHIKIWALPIVPVKEDGVIAAKDGDSIKRREISRKRSHDDYMKGQQEILSRVGGAQKDGIQVEQDPAHRIREYAVHEMFRSSWRANDVVEMPLSDVKLPAKLFVRDPTTNDLKRYEGPIYNNDGSMPKINVFVRKAWPGALIHELPPTAPSATALTYILQHHAQRGKFNRQKAKALKVPVGPMYGVLANGGSVTLEDGTIVTADQVLEPGRDGRGVAIVDLPSRAYVSPLLSRPEWSQGKIMRGVGAFIWILGPGVAQDESITAFMKQFKDVHHILSSLDQCANQFMMSSAAIASVRHHMVDPERYSLLQHQNTPESTTVGPKEGLNVVQAKPGLTLQLEPSIEFQDSQVHHPVNLVEALDEVSPKVYKLAEQARATVQADIAHSRLHEQNLPSPDAEIICLGTGSASPSLHRNVSGTLLRVPGRGSYLFDAGENTLGQLKRIFSPKELSEVLQDLKMIWISHLHADHHLGTAAIIKAWYNEVHGQDTIKRPRPSPEEQALKTSELLTSGRRLFIASSAHMMRWLAEYSSVEDIGYDQLVPLEVGPVRLNTAQFGDTRLKWNSADVGFNCLDLSIRAAMRAATGLENLSACLVSHCLNAMAVSISFADGFKFSYSGDCRPSQALAVIGKGSTVLVHEATFDDEMQHEAQLKKHSTISEAVGVGAQMGARRVILTHFSQRYSKIPTMSDLDGATVKLESDEPEADGDQMEPIQDLDFPIEVGFFSPSHPETRETPKDEEDIQQQSSHQQPSSVQAKLTVDPVNLRQSNDMKIAVAFDYMRVKVKDIASLEHFTPAFRELYKADELKQAADRKRTWRANNNRRTSGAGSGNNNHSNNYNHNNTGKNQRGESRQQQNFNTSEGAQQREGKGAATGEECSGVKLLESDLSNLNIVSTKVGNPISGERSDRDKSHDSARSVLSMEDRTCDKSGGLTPDHRVMAAVETSPRSICAS